MKRIMAQHHGSDREYDECDVYVVYDASKSYRLCVRCGTKCDKYDEEYGNNEDNVDDDDVDVDDDDDDNALLVLSTISKSEPPSLPSICEYDEEDWSLSSDGKSIFTVISSLLFEFEFEFGFELSELSRVSKLSKLSDSD